MSMVLRIRILLHLMIDCKNLYTSLSSKKNHIEKSIRADMNCFRLEFQRFNVVRIIWVPWKINPADTGTMSDILFAWALQLPMVDGRLAHRFVAAEACGTDRPLR